MSLAACLAVALACLLAGIAIGALLRRGVSRRHIATLAGLAVLIAVVLGLLAARAERAQVPVALPSPAAGAPERQSF